MGKAPLRKLSAEDRVEICQLLSRFARPKEIIKEFKDKGISISVSTVIFYQKAKSWKPLIDRLRDEYLAGVLEIPIAHKRVRLERLEDLYQRAFSTGKINIAKDILSASQSELEGKHSNINLIMNKIEMISDAELEDRKIKILADMKKVVEIEKVEVT